MERVVVVGCSGSGKTTVARMLGERLGAPVTDLDGLFWLPGWQERPDDEFLPMVEQAVVGDRWVLSGNYRRTQHLTWPRATTIVWLDLPKPAVMRQVVARTVRRAVTGEECCNGNRERVRQWFDRDDNIMLWAWRNHAPTRERYAAAMEGDDRWVRLTSRRAVARWLDSVPANQGT